MLGGVFSLLALSWDKRPAEEAVRMRWKLLLVTSLLATLVGAGASLGIIYGLTGSVGRVRSPDVAVIGALVIPVAAIAFASFFVYRHT
ncbi:MAG: hypothetical protein LC672_04290, partial [Acidobacteria bacterium]|nr:hypothetical protein [Acidobacteriota bacterium]